MLILRKTHDYLGQAKVVEHGPSVLETLLGSFVITSIQK